MIVLLSVAAVCLFSNTITRGVTLYTLGSPIYETIVHSVPGYSGYYLMLSVYFYVMTPLRVYLISTGFPYFLQLELGIIYSLQYYSDRIVYSLSRFTQTEVRKHETFLSTQYNNVQELISRYT
jgi:hypothetical protein